MSRATEIAEREAAEAEAEHPDPIEPVEPQSPDEPSPDAPDGEPEPSSPPEPAPVTEAMLQKVGQAIAAEDARHEKALRKAYGELWGDRQPCPLCLQEGFVTIAQPGEFDPTQREAVVAAMGEGAAMKLKPAKDTRRCETCDGWGECDSQARREATQRVECVDCGGLGYVREAPKLYEVPAANTGQAWTPPDPSTVLGAAAANTDGWGRPMGHPHWGIAPAQAGL